MFKFTFFYKFLLPAISLPFLLGFIIGSQNRLPTLANFTLVDNITDNSSIYHNWKAYQNPLGWQIKYPPNFKISANQTDKIFPANYDMTIQIKSEPDTNTTSILDWFYQKREEAKSPSCTKDCTNNFSQPVDAVKIGNYTAIQQYENSTIQTLNYYILLPNHIIISATISSKNPSLNATTILTSYQILSTLSHN